MTSDVQAPPITVLLARVANDIGAVAKADRNEQQGYAFRGIDALLNGCHDALTEHGVVILPEVVAGSLEMSIYETHRGTQMRHVRFLVNYHFTGPGGDSVTATVATEAADAADKAIPKAMSQALKYALIQTFTIPTEDIADPDRETPAEMVPPRQAQVRDARPPEDPETVARALGWGSQAIRDSRVAELQEASRSLGDDDAEKLRRWLGDQHYRPSSLTPEQAGEWMDRVRQLSGVYETAEPWDTGAAEGAVDDA